MYLNNLENSLLDEGLRIIIEEDFINKLIEINSTPDSNLEDLLFKLENIDCRKSHSSALRTWNRRMMLLLTGHKVPQRMHIFMRVKNALMVRVTEVYTKLNKPVKAKPILKVKTKSTKVEDKWKTRALKAEEELRKIKESHRLEVSDLNATINTLNSEKEVLQSVAKQAVLNNVSLMSSMGVTVTAEDLNL